MYSYLHKYMIYIYIYIFQKWSDGEFSMFFFDQAWKHLKQVEISKLISNLNLYVSIRSVVSRLPSNWWMKRQELLQRPVHESFEGRLRRADRVCKRARHQRSSGACQMVQECVWFPDFLCCRSAMWKWKEIAYTAKDSPCAPVAHAGNSQRIFVIAVLFLLSLVRKTLLPSEEKATGGVSPDEQLLFWRRVLGQMKVIAVQRELQLNDPGDLAAILRLGILLRFSFLRQKSKKSDSHVRILSRQSVCRWLENRSQI